MLFKRMVFVVLAVLLLAGSEIGQADPIFFGTCKVILDKGSENGFGLGGNFDVGLPVGDRVILRGTYDAYKTHDGTGYDNGFTGFTVLSGPLFEKVNAGMYLTAEGGISKVTGVDVEFATLASMGCYVGLKEFTKVWIGGGYSSVAEQGQIWHVTFALSIEAPLGK